MFEPLLTFIFLQGLRQEIPIDPDAALVVKTGENGLRIALLVPGLEIRTQFAKLCLVHPPLARSSARTRIAARMAWSDG